MPTIKPFSDFKLFKAADNAVIEKYKNVLPQTLIDIWKEYGFGSFAKGFLKTINPDEYQELLNETYISDKNPIPIFTTALGDILVLREEYPEGKKWFDIDIVFYRDGDDSLVCGEKSFFAQELTDLNSYKNDFFWGDYIGAVKKYGTIPEYDECYGYVPLLGLGGKKTVKNMQIVKIKEHIMLIKEMVGPVKYRKLNAG